MIKHKGAGKLRPFVHAAGRRPRRMPLHREANAMQPKTLLQYFEWYLPADAGHWKRAAAHAAHLRQAGFTGRVAAAGLQGRGGAQ